MIEASALGLVVLAAVYFIALAGVSLLIPASASRFLLGFAGSPFKHYTELFVRFLVGAALVLHAPRTVAPSAFAVFGWLLLVTTACLLLVPWRWHQRFAQYAVPQAARHISLIGLASLALGGVMLVAVVLGSAA